MAWTSGAVVTNPATDAILVDTGALPVGQSDVRVMFGGNAAAVATIELRDAANSANVKSQTVAIAANQLLEVHLPGVDFAASERVRVRLNVGITGSLQASIFAF